jgi:hypothetical protein
MPGGKAQLIMKTGIEMDFTKFLYYLDADGDVARKARQVAGARRSDDAEDDDE